MKWEIPEEVRHESPIRTFLGILAGIVALVLISTPWSPLTWVLVGILVLFIAGIRVP